MIWGTRGRFEYYSLYCSLPIMGMFRLHRGPTPRRWSRSPRAKEEATEVDMPRGEKDVEKEVRYRLGLPNLGVWRSGMRRS